MDDFKLTDEQLAYLCDLIINHDDPHDERQETFTAINAEITRREELAKATAGLSLDDCDSCKL